MGLTQALDTITLTAQDILAALNVTTGFEPDDTVPGLRFTDRHQITYSGVASHIVLAALARKDITPQIGETKETTKRARVAAHFLWSWFLCDQTPPEHAARFETMPVDGVCRMIAHLAVHGQLKVIRQVGPEALPLYTELLLRVADGDHPEPPMPTVVDVPPAYLGDPRELSMTATAPDNADMVVVVADVEASEDVHWDFTGEFGIPVSDVHALMTGGLDFGSYLEDNRDLVDGYLDYSTSWTNDGLKVEARPRAIKLGFSESEEETPSVPDTPDGRVDTLTVYYVGEHRDHAMSNGALLSQAEAETRLRQQPGSLLFTAEVTVPVATLTGPPIPPKAVNPDNALRIFVATAQTQGQRDNDFTWTAEGEPVTLSFVCDTNGSHPDGSCGCARSWDGMISRKGSTTAVVADVDMTEEQYVTMLLNYYREFGLLKDDAPDNAELVEFITHRAEWLLAEAQYFPVGTIVERRGDDLAERDTTTPGTCD